MDAVKLYLHPKLLAVMLLGIASGLPLALVAGSLSVWLTEEGLSLGSIGLFASVGTPYALKFLWAPLIDNLRLPFFSHVFGRRRGWLFASQILLIAAIAGLGLSNPHEAIMATAVLAVLVAFLSATQDIIIDAYRIEILEREQYAAGSAMIILGYRIGMIISGAGALFLATQIGWQMTYMSMSLVILIGTVAALWAGEPAAKDVVAKPQHGFVSWLENAVIEPFIDFMKRPYWLAILVFVVLYRLGDALAGVMTNPFLIKIGFSKEEIATVVKIGGMAATIFGTFCGGAVAARLGVLKGLWISGVLHLLTNFFLIIQAHVGHNVPMLWLTIGSENFTGGISSAIFVAFISGLCNARFTATQYALLSSLAVVGRTLLSSVSGFMAENMSWEWFFFTTILAALPGLAMLVWMQRKKLIV